MLQNLFSISLCSPPIDQGIPWTPDLQQNCQVKWCGLSASFCISLKYSSQGGNESETKAVFIVGTLLQSETLDLIHSIVESSDFQHCTILCTVPESVHSFARHAENADVSPFGELSQRLREWMGNMVSKINNV